MLAVTDNVASKPEVVISTPITTSNNSEGKTFTTYTSSQEIQFRVLGKEDLDSIRCAAYDYLIP